MDRLEMTINPELVITAMEATGAEEAIELLGRRLEQHGYVKDGYLAAVLTREKAYPTGLPTGEVGVAIPHADAVHVLAPAIAIGTLAKPVLFRNMAEAEETLPVDLVFLLAVKDPAAQVDVLQRLMAVFADAGLLNALRTGGDPAEICRLMTAALAGKE